MEYQPIPAEQSDLAPLPDFGGGGDNTEWTTDARRRIWSAWLQCNPKLGDEHLTGLVMVHAGVMNKNKIENWCTVMRVIRDNWIKRFTEWKRQRR